MNKHLKKALSMALAVTMGLSSISTSAFATEEYESETQEITVESAEETNAAEEAVPTEAPAVEETSQEEAPVEESATPSEGQEEVLSKESADGGSEETVYEGAQDVLDNGTSEAEPSGSPADIVLKEKDSDKEDFLKVNIDAMAESDSDTEFRIYFWQYNGTVPDNADDWKTYFTDPFEELEFKDLDEQSLDMDLEIVLSDGNRSEVNAGLNYKTEKRESDGKDVLKAVFLDYTMPAGSSMNEDLYIAHDAITASDEYLMIEGRYVDGLEEYTADYLPVVFEYNPEDDVALMYEDDDEFEALEPDESPDGEDECKSEDASADEYGINTLASDSDGDVLDQSVVADIQSWDGVTEGLTGEALSAMVYAYNDNPNSSAVADVRFYVEQTDGTMPVVPMPAESIDLQLSSLTGSDLSESVITAVWYMPEEADANGITNEGSDPYSTNAYLELELPAGASVDFDLDFTVEPGYDSFAQAKFYYEMDEEGKDAERYDSDLVLTWTGDAEWDDFAKSADTEKIICADGFDPEIVTWSFGAENLTNGKAGYIYTDSIVLSDALVLPEGITFPDDAYAEENQIFDADGNVIYEITSENEYDEISLRVAEDLGTVSYTIKISNSEEPDIAFNPVSGIKAVLYASYLDIAEDITIDEDTKFMNSASLTAYSVETDEDGNIVIYEGMADSEIMVTDEADKSFDKKIVSITDNKGTIVYGDDAEESNLMVSEDGIPLAYPGNTVSYQISVAVTGPKASVSVADTIPKGLTLDEGSIAITADGKELDYAVETEETEDGMVMTITVTVPANSTAYIDYDCIVDEKDDDAEYPLTLSNKAKLDGEEKTTDLIIPEDGEVTFTKEVVYKKTTSITGSTLEIWKNEDGTYEYSGDADASSNSSKMSDQSFLAEEICRLQAGDIVEYLITFDNQTGDYFEGTIVDVQPFAAVSSGYGKDNVINSAMNMQTGDWEYYVAGSNSYLVGNANTRTYGSQSASGQTVKTDSDAVSNIESICMNWHSDLESVDLTTDSSYMTDDGVRGWTFEDNNKLEPYSAYFQTTVVVIPGDNMKSTATTANLQWEDLHAAYSCYCGGDYGTTSSSYYNYDWTTWAYANLDVYEDDDIISSFEEDSSNILHTVKGQTYMNTGVLATGTMSSSTVTEAFNNGEVCAPFTGTSSFDDSYRYNANYYVADGNALSVNFVYIYNDSDEEMPLSDYTLTLSGDSHWKILGLTYCYAATSHSNGYHTDRLYYPGYSSSLSEDVYSSYAMNGYDVCILSSSGTSSSPYYAASSSGNPISYYSNSSISANFMSYNTSSFVSRNASENSSVKFSMGSTGFSSTNISMTGSIAPYSGILLEYLAQETSNVQDQCSFSASLYYEKGYLSLCPTVNCIDQRFHSSFAGGNSCAGLANYGGDCIDYAGSYRASATHCSSPSRPHYLGSSCYISGILERVAVSVTKDVVKNSGQTGGEYDSLLSDMSIVGWNTDYDDYIWNYSLPDGIHRTVDGTVTWHVNIANDSKTGSNPGNGQSSYSPSTAYGHVNYGTLIETIDSPYLLKELYIPEICYISADAVSNSSSSSYEKNMYFEFPVADPADSEAMINAGWSNNGDCFTYVAMGRSENTSTLVSSSSNSPLYVKVTASCIDGGSLGYGADVEGGNTQAYQYVIEFLEYFNYGQKYYPELALAGNSSAQSEVDLYLTFATDESIETNYNSFAWVSKYANDSQYRGQISVSAGEMMPASYTHGNAGVLSVNAVDSSYLTLLSGDLEEEEVAGTDGISAYSFSIASDTSPTSIASNKYIVQANDWTDTSYTDGTKTLSVLDENGDVISSINSKSDGNMVLPEGIESGTTIRVNLDVESVLYESERYTSLNNLVIYDTYGVEGTDPVTSGYDVDLSSIVVRLVTSSGTSTMTRGVDYEIYYTYSPLVTGEHHPLPVNTLDYAADLSSLESVEWIKYDPDNGYDGDDAYAFKIVMLDGGAASSLARYDWQHVYVDYDAVVREDVVTGETYPNVLAYTGRLYDSVSDVYKAIQEDTTAMQFVALDADYPVLTKEVTDENGNGISNSVGDEFTYMIVRTNNTYGYIYSASYVKGVAVATVKAGEPTILDDENLKVLYNTYASGDDSAQAFWDNAGYNFIVFEVDSNGYTNDSMSISASSGLSYSGTQTAPRANYVAGLDLDYSKISEDLAETIQAFLGAQTTSTVVPSVYFRYTSGSVWVLSLTGVNTVVPTEFTIQKVDENGDEILGTVGFSIKDSDDNTLWFTYSDGRYTYSGTEESDGALDELTFSGTAVITGLPMGTYTLTEISTPKGYEFTEDLVFTVGSGKVTDKNGDEFTDNIISVVDEEADEEPTGTLTLAKIDASTGEPITGDETFTASFEVYDAEQNLLGFTRIDAGSYIYDGEETAVSTDSSTGMFFIDGLPLGTYYLVETDAPHGYELNYGTLDDAYEFTVSRNNTDIVVELENTFVSASLTVTKENADGEPISDNPATFVIMDEDGTVLGFTGSDGVYEYDAEGVEEELTTGSDGRLILNGMPKGSYTVKEVLAPKGYEISSEDAVIAIEYNDSYELTVSDDLLPAVLRIAKTFRNEGDEETYPLVGVSFTLYKADGNAAENVADGITDSDGLIDLGLLDGWTGTYYLYEDVPNGYTATNDTVTMYLNDDTGKIDLDISEPTDGHTAIECIELDFSKYIADDEFEYDDNVIIFSLDILNIKTEVYHGTFASTSYKTIDNHKSAEYYQKHGVDLESETGYSFFYEDSDYEAGNYNYVHAVNSGDVVTYTLNVSNISNHKFESLSIIDRLPEIGDTGVVNQSEKRDSEFSVQYFEDELYVTVDGKLVDPDMYEITFSDKTGFSNNDFDGVSAWHDSVTEDTKSFRIVFDDDFYLNPNQMLTVTFDGTVGDDAEVAQIAWNNFAYRYTAVENLTSEEIEDYRAEENVEVEVLDDIAEYSADGVQTMSAAVTLTPEPPKVGVMIIDDVFTAVKQWEDDDDALGIRPDEITFDLYVRDEGTGDLYGIKNGEVTISSDGTVTNTADSGDALFDGTGSVVATGGLNDDGDQFCTWENLPVLTDEYSYAANEQELEHYLSEVIETEEGALVVNTLETVDIEGAKTWNDNDDQDGMRPSEITVNLYADGTKIESKTVTGDGWTYSFNDLPKYSYGNEIVYTVDEDEVDGYVSEVIGYEIINTHIPEVTEISVEKVWDDNDNQDGARPNSITVELLKNGDTAGMIALSDSNGWTGKFENLPVYTDGVKNKYEIAEISVSGYNGTVASETDSDGNLSIIITNTHTPEVTSVSGVKTWDDAGNQDGKRPSEITVRLYADNVEVGSRTVTGDDWTYEFTNLPKYSNGKEIVYTVSEDTVEGYTTEINGYDITNSYTPGTTQISVRKVWEDGDNQDGVRPSEVTVELLKNGVATGTTAKLNDGNSWSCIFADLDEFENGNEITWSVAEASVDGYDSVLSGGMSEGYTITNTHATETVSVSGTKTWNDGNNQDGIRPSEVTVWLYADGVAVDSTTVSSADGWAYSFSDLPKYRDGVEIKYTVSEDQVKYYTTEINGYDITNSYTPSTVYVSVEKTWDDNGNQDGKRPDELTVYLYADGVLTDSEVLNESNEWSCSFTDLPEYKDGTRINYAVSEMQVEGYSSEVDHIAINGVLGDEDFDTTEGIIYYFVNSYTPGKTSVSVEKRWDDGDDRDGIRPSEVTVELLKNGSSTGTTIVLNEGNNWSGTFADLDEYTDGVLNRYSVDEHEVDGYDCTLISGSRFDEESGSYVYTPYVFTNHHTPETTSVSGTKTWDDNDDQDGARPSEITVRLYADGVEADSMTVTADDGWRYEFTDLPKNSDGAEITYTVAEDQVSGYTSVVSGYDITNSYTPGKTQITVHKAWDDNNNQDGVRPDSVTVELLKNGSKTGTTAVLNEGNSWSCTFSDLDEYENGSKITWSVSESTISGYEGILTGSMSEGYTFTNTHVPETVDVSGKKVWDDGNDKYGARPESITVILLADGEAVDSRTVTGNSWTFANLPKYRDGKEIVYTFEENPADGYEASYSKDGLTITNTYISEPKITKELAEDDYARKDNDTLHDEFEENIEGDGWGSWDDADNGQEVSYRLTLTDITKATNLTVHDYLEDGLDFERNTVVVEIYDDNNFKILDEGIDYEIYERECTDPAGCAMDGCTFEVVFADKVFEGLSYDAYLVISYNALTETNADDYEDYEDAILNYSYMTYGAETMRSRIVTTETELFGFGIYKYAANNEEAALEGAEFVLERNGLYATVDAEVNEDDGKIYYLISGWTEEIDDASKLVSGEDGMIRIEGLDDDEYQIIEVEAPEGYEILDESIVVVIDENGDVMLKNEDGKKEAAVGHVVSVKNTASETEPEPEETESESQSETETEPEETESESQSEKETETETEAETTTEKIAETSTPDKPNKNITNRPNDGSTTTTTNDSPINSSSSSSVDDESGAKGGVPTGDDFNIIPLLAALAVIAAFTAFGFGFSRKKKQV